MTDAPLVYDISLYDGACYEGTTGEEEKLFLSDPRPRSNEVGSSSLA